MVTDTALFRYPAYHSNTDRPEFVQYERMARIVSGLHAVIGDMADIPKCGRSEASRHSTLGYYSLAEFEARTAVA
jgi:hypothetical protein